MFGGEGNDAFRAAALERPVRRFGGAGGEVQRPVRPEPFDAACGVALGKLRRGTPPSGAEALFLGFARMGVSTSLDTNGWIGQRLYYLLPRHLHRSSRLTPPLARAVRIGE